MKIGFIGYGKMNRLIEKIALEQGHTIEAIIDIGKEEFSTDVDCYIDFATAKATMNYFPKACEAKIPIVIGTTGWYEHRNELTQICENAGNTCVWAGNFSLGVNLFWQIVGKATQFINPYTSEYDAMVSEKHHRQKIDGPSGTALQTGEIICEHSQQKDQIVTDLSKRSPEENELHVSFLRGGHFHGTHTVAFDSPFYNISITHTAKTREGFARGALLACEKIHKLPKGFHNFKDILNQFYS